MEKITSAEDPLLKPFLTLRKAHRSSIIVDGPVAVRKLLKSGLQIKRIIAPLDFHEQEKTENFNCEVFVIDKSILKSIIGLKFHTGVMAWASQPSFDDLAINGNRLLILNAVAKPDNIGAIIRSALGLGIEQIVYDNECASPFLRRSIRTSMGNTFFCSHHLTHELVSTLRVLKENGFEIIATDANNPTNSLADHRFAKKTAIIVGSEGHGIRQEVLLETDKRLAIPVTDQVAHYNAACATSIVLYEQLRQLSHQAQAT